MTSRWLNADTATSGSSTTIINGFPDQYLKTISWVDGLLTITDQGGNVTEIPINTTGGSGDTTGGGDNGTNDDPYVPSYSAGNTDNTGGLPLETIEVVPVTFFKAHPYGTENEYLVADSMVMYDESRKYFIFDPQETPTYHLGTGSVWVNNRITGEIPMSNSTPFTVIGIGSYNGGGTWWSSDFLKCVFGGNKLELRHFGGAVMQATVNNLENVDISGFLKQSGKFKAIVLTCDGTNISFRHFDLITGEQLIDLPQTPTFSSQVIEPYESLNVECWFQSTNWVLRQLYVKQKALTNDEILEAIAVYQGGAVGTTEFSDLEFA